MVTKIVLELSNLFSHEILILVDFMKKRKRKIWQDCTMIWMIVCNYVLIDWHFNISVTLIGFFIKAKAN